MPPLCHGKPNDFFKNLAIIGLGLCHHWARCVSSWGLACVIIGLDPIISIVTKLIKRDCRIKSGNDINQVLQ